MVIVDEFNEILKNVQTLNNEDVEVVIWEPANGMEHIIAKIEAHELM